MSNSLSHSNGQMKIFNFLDKTADPKSEHLEKKEESFDMLSNIKRRNFIAKYECIEISCLDVITCKYCSKHFPDEKLLLLLLVRGSGRPDPTRLIIFF